MSRSSRYDFVNCRILLCVIPVMAYLPAGVAQSTSAGCDHYTIVLNHAWQLNSAMQYQDSHRVLDSLLNNISADCPRTARHARFIKCENWLEQNAFDDLVPTCREILQGTAGSSNTEDWSLHVFTSVLLSQYYQRGQDLDSMLLVLDSIESFVQDKLTNKHTAVAKARYFEAVASVKRELLEPEAIIDLLMQSKQLIDAYQIDDAKVIFNTLFALSKNQMARGQFDNAIRNVTRCKQEVIRLAGRHHHMHASCLSLEARIHDEQGEYQMAGILLDSSIAIMRACFGPGYLGTSLRLAERGSVWNKMGEYDKAYAVFRQSERIMEQTVPELNERHIAQQSTLGALAERMGRIDEAKDYYTRVYERFEEAFLSYYPLLSESQRSVFIGTWSPLLENYFSFALRQQSGDPSLSDMALSMQMKVKGMSAYLLRQENMAATHSDEIRSLLDRRANAKQKIYDLVTSQNLDIDVMQLAEVEMQAVEKVLRDVRFSGLRGIEGLHVDSILTIIPTQSAIIDFFPMRYTDLDGNISHLYTVAIINPDDVTEQKVHWINLGDLAQFGKPDGQAFCVSGADSEVLNKTWRAIDPHIRNAQTLFITASGPLMNFPFACMTASLDAQDIPVRIVYFNSYNELSAKAPMETPKHVALFGNPSYTSLLSGDIEFDKNLDEDLMRGISGLVIHPLPGAEAELEYLKHRFNNYGWKTTTRLKTRATETHFKDLSETAKPFSILHIAAHGYFIPRPEKNSSRPGLFSVIEKIDDPMYRSGLIFDRGDDDGFLTAYELAGMDFSSLCLAVLSACNTGKGSADRFEGAIGLQRALRISGARNLILTNWDVPDEPTFEFMQQLYDHMLTGTSLQDAFHLTQSQMKKLHGPDVWAAFSLWSGFEPFSIESGQKGHWLWWIVAGIVLFGFLGLYVRHR